MTTSVSPTCSCFDDNSVNKSERVVKCLPENHFDVVTFCLLLSYVPSPSERLKFCAKARRLLKFNGILLITETQSVTPHNNLMLMKQWQVEIEELGFRRFRYESMTHIHAMAFRKVPNWLRRCSAGSEDASVKFSKRRTYKPEGLLIINQDCQVQNGNSGLTAKIPEPAHKKRKLNGNDPS